MTKPEENRKAVDAFIQYQLDHYKRTGQDQSMAYAYLTGFLGSVLVSALGSLHPKQRDIILKEIER